MKYVQAPTVRFFGFFYPQGSLARSSIGINSHFIECTHVLGQTVVSLLIVTFVSTQTTGTATTHTRAHTTNLFLSEMSFTDKTIEKCIETIKMSFANLHNKISNKRHTL